MKKDIHPTYYSDAKVTCACGAEFRVGSTMKEINVEICSACHPFFTGTEKVMDLAGRVEKFKARREAAKTHTANTKKPKALKKTRAASKVLSKKTFSAAAKLVKAKAKKTESVAPQA